ncbi:MAG: YraN family protein [Clostridia bacterium]
MTSRAVGVRGEEIAAAYLQSRGFLLLAAHYQIRGAEIDLIAQDGAYRVFVEVKYRTDTHFSMPREAVTCAKQRRICRAALRWLTEQGRTEDYVRFDVVEVTPMGVTHWPNAFDAPYG